MLAATRCAASRIQPGERSTADGGRRKRFRRREPFGSPPFNFRLGGNFIKASTAPGRSQSTHACVPFPVHGTGRQCLRACAGRTGGIACAVIFTSHLTDVHGRQEHAWQNWHICLWERGGSREAECPSHQNEQRLEGCGRAGLKIHENRYCNVHPDQSLESAGKVLTEMQITGAPVVDTDGALIGVLSRHDLLYKIAGMGSLKGVQEGGARSVRYLENTKRIRKLEAETVSGAMTPFPVNLNQTATMQEAAALMLRRNLNRVLITEPGSEKLAGIISSTDVFRLAFGDAAAQWREEGTEKAGL